MAARCEMMAAIPAAEALLYGQAGLSAAGARGRRRWQESRRRGNEGTKRSIQHINNKTMRTMRWATGTVGALQGATSRAHLFFALLR